MTTKPTAYENFAFPYPSLPSNTFVNLVCSIFKNEIKYGEFLGIFDDAQNIDGTNDRGRDINLYKNGKSFGIVQCKRYKNNINISDFENEIFKFVLHYIKDKTLIHDIYNFRYYYVAPKFAESTINYINDFNKSIKSDNRLKDKIENVISHNKRDLTDLKYETVKNELLSVLSRIKIEKIHQDNLEDYLSKDYNKDIISRYFEVKKLILFDTEINVEAVNIDFKKASEDLITNQRYEFGNLPNSQIERLETEKLLDWVKLPIKDKESPIFVLVGKAGYGKSVIMQQLTQKLQQEEIPTLSIKTDRYLAVSIRELQERLYLKYDIIDSVKELALEYDRVVILLDQIDALCQSQSLRNDYAITYRKLISELKEQKNIRIIVSVREYDLATEVEFKNLKEYNKINVALLSDENVNEIISQLKIKRTLPKKLLELLKTPNYLDTFCQVYKSIKSFDTIHTLQDLYKILWKNKLSKSKKIGLVNVKILVYNLAQRMYEMGLNIPHSLFEDEFEQEIVFLSSEGIITTNNNKIQFFHQTYYDFVYAKMFAEQNQDMLKYIKENNCSLEVRATIKMVLAFLREQNPKKHITCIDEIIHSKDVAFHIKLLIINLLGYLEDPEVEEKEFAKNNILFHADYGKLLIENTFSESWLKFFINEGVLNSLILSNDKIQINRWRIILMNNLIYSSDTVLEYIDNIDFDFEDKTIVIRDLLFRNENWANPIAKKLFENYYVEFTLPNNSEDRWFYYILEKAIDEDSDWVIEKFKQDEIKKITLKTQERKLGEGIYFNHHANELLTKLFDKFPVKTLKFCMEILEIVLRRTQYPIKDTELLNDYSWGVIIDDDGLYFEESDDNRKTFLKTLAKNIKLFAKDNSSIFRDFKENYKNTPFIRLQRLLLIGCIQNPIAYANDVYQFIIHFNNLQGFSVLGTTIEGHLRKAISLSYSFFDGQQKITVNSILSNIKIPREKEYYKDWLKDKFIEAKHSNWSKKDAVHIGFCKYAYLSSIPQSEFDNFPTLKKEILELKRRFGEYKPSPRQRGILRGVPPPLPANAYEKMNNVQWLSSLKNIQSKDDNVFSLKGGISEHSRAFREQIEIRPNDFISIIEIIVEDEEVSGDYITAALDGLKQAKYDAKKLRNIWVKAINRSQNRGFEQSLIWITEYFIAEKVVNNEIINYLVHISLQNENNKEIESEDSLMKGINTIQGAAVSKLVLCFEDKNYKKVIFDTLIKITDNCSIATKCAIIHQLYYLINLDLQQTLTLFKKLTEVVNWEVYKNAINTAFWLSKNNFKSVKYFYITCLDYTENEEFLSKVAESIFILWLSDIEECYELLNLYLESSYKCQNEVLSDAGRHYFESNGKFSAKCNIIFEKFLDNEDPNIVQGFDSVFYKDEINFCDLLPFMKKYTKSKAAKVRFPMYFYMYIMNFTKDYPQECLDLVEYFDTNHGKDDNFYPSYLIDSVLMSYKNLSDSDKINKRRAINVFDKALTDDNYRFQALSVLTNADS